MSDDAAVSPRPPPVLPERLYGRDSELSNLLEIFTKVRESRPRLVLLQGPPGIGKSALAEALSRPVERLGGLLVSGRFQAPPHDRPYQALIEALRHRLRRLLMAKAEVLAAARVRLGEALGTSRALLVGLLPELRHLIAIPPHARVSEPEQVQVRVWVAMTALVKALSGSDQPLLIVLDDLQWADTASLELLGFILTEPDLRGLMVLGAMESHQPGLAGLPERREVLSPPYEPQPYEFPTDNPVLVRKGGAVGDLLARLETRGLLPHWLFLPPLDRTASTQLVADACGWQGASEAVQAEVGPLAILLREKTAGNPFFLRTLLLQLFQDGLLVPWSANPNAVGESWPHPACLEAIARVSVSDNVAGLMLEILRRLPVETQQQLSMAAYLGQSFSLLTLARAQAIPLERLWQPLEPAIAPGLLMLEPSSGESDPAPTPPSPHTRLRFAHARLQAAALALIPESARASQHLALGRALLQAFRSEAPELDVEGARLELVAHFAPAVSLLEPEERPEIADIAQAAGDHARQAAAFERAWTCYRLGLEALGLEVWRAASAPDYTGRTSAARNTAPQAIPQAAPQASAQAAPSLDPWQEHRPILLALCAGGAEATFILGRRPEMNWLIETVLAHESDRVKTLPLWDTRIRAHLADARMRDALRVADRFLMLAGRPQPQGSSVFWLVWSLLITFLWLRGRTPERLATLPEATDPLAAGVQHIQVLVAPAQLLEKPQLLPLAVLRDVRSVLRDGVTASGAQCWTGLGMLVNGLFGKAILANRYGDLALTLAERLQRGEGGRDVLPRLRVLVYVLLRPWTTPLRELVAPLQHTTRSALAVGDVNFAMLGAFMADMFAFLAGESLEILWPRLQQTHEQLVRHHHPSVLQLHRPLHRLVARWRMAAPTLKDTSDLEPPPHPWAALLEGLTALHDALLEGDARRAFALAQVPQPPLEDAVQHPPFMAYRTYAALACLAAVEQGWIPPRRLRGRLRRTAHSLKAWTRHVPTRRYLQTWIEAARLRSQQHSLAALACYDLALLQAQEGGHRLDVGLIAEHAAGLCDGMKRPTLALAYRQQALQAYHTWGAVRKVQQLLQAHPTLTLPTRATGERRAAAPFPPGDETVDDIRALRQVLTSALALSEVRGVSRLLSRIVQTVQENSGATRVSLVLLQGTQPLVQAWRELGEADVSVGPAHALEDASRLAVGVVHFVLRTGELVRLDDAPQTGPFVEEPHVVASQVRSMLCVPLMRAQAVRGALYLEHATAREWFTPSRVEAIRLLAAQAIIALDHASLTESLEARVQQRTIELEVARQKAEQASQVRQDFLSHMSHELRTPLNAILGYARLLQQPQPAPKPGSDTEVQQGLRLIERSGQHLLGLINDVLDMTRLEAERLELQPETFSLPGLVQDVWGLLASTAREKGLVLEASVAPEVPAQAWGDGRRLRQVLLNLVGNALKFTGQGSVRLGLTPLHKETALSGRMDPLEPRVRFEVQDTGPGIEETQAGLLFRPFEQAGAPGQRIHGTGLGLAISQQLVRLMGGNLEVVSRVGEGSRFWFDLTLARASAPVGQGVFLSTGVLEGGSKGSSDETPSDGMVLPDRKTLEQLQLLARRGNLSQLKQVLQQLVRESEAYGPFVGRLERLADDFDDARILAVLEQGLNGAASPHEE